MSAKTDYENFQKKIRYSFQDLTYLQLALTHSSYANELTIARKKAGYNERIEFLGDAVLELVSSDYIYKNNAAMSEGDMTKLRASIVCEPTLAACARQIGLDDYILLGKGEEATGGRKRDSIVSDAMEALIGAIYLDGGFEPAQAFIH
ncbi:MAG: ribonuclease III, partial [Lachnospiraceae bacterium]